MMARRNRNHRWLPGGRANSTLLLVLALIVLSPLPKIEAAAAADRIDPALRQAMAAAPPNEPVSALIYLWDQGDIDELDRRLRAERAPRGHRSEEVLRTLRDTAEFGQRRLITELDRRRQRGEIAGYEPLWIANAIRVDGSPELIEELGTHPDVRQIFLNAEIESIRSVEADARPRKNAPPPPPPGELAGSGDVPAGIAAINAPNVWAMGIRGEGVVVASLDSGVDGNHPAFASRWRGLDPAFSANPQWSWFDPVTGTNFPAEFDSDSHGTHTMGTILGGGPGQPVGVAPKAQWIHAAVIDRVDIATTVADVMLALEWIVDPDGDPATTHDVPHICSNSWGLMSQHGYPACDQLFWAFLDHARASGIVMLFAAGNEGLGGLRRPADRATDDERSVAVGAIDPHQVGWPVATFSSRGPTHCTPSGSPAIKPDLAAPGVGTYSTVKGGGYGSKNGTSMAVPHVAGVAALMLEACPELNPDEVIDILYETAVDLGAPGKNNQYGHGMVDAHAAVLLAKDNCGISINVPGAPGVIGPGETVTFTVNITETNESILPGSAVLMVRQRDGSFAPHPLIETAEGSFQAELTGETCGETIRYYALVEGDAGTVRTAPTNAPEETFTAEVGLIMAGEVLAEDFAGGLPPEWEATGLWTSGDPCPVPGACEGVAGAWAYYGKTETCTYETGTQTTGSLLSPPITLPQTENDSELLVQFCYALETEASPIFDRAMFSVLGDEETKLPESFGWSSYVHDLSAYAGATIRLRWRFDSIDGVLNNFRGWHVANVRIIGDLVGCPDVEPGCEADLTGDGQVNVFDLLELLDQWGSCEACEADLTGDGLVNVFDLLVLLDAWGPCDR